jgi:predicted nucleic acid-binding protein
LPDFHAGLQRICECLAQEVQAKLAHYSAIARQFAAQRAGPSEHAANRPSSIGIAERYGFSFYDSLIIAAALETGCTTLYSEDLQYGQVIDGKLTIQSPFV